MNEGTNRKRKLTGQETNRKRKPKNEETNDQNDGNL